MPLATLLVFAILHRSTLLFAALSSQARPQLATLPDNPCELLTREQMAALTKLEVTTVHREPSINKLVEAQRANREPAPGTICVYDTRSAFGGLSVFVPARPTRSAGAYWTARSQYFATYPGSARPIPNLGLDAWLAGGADLHVLVRDNEYFAVSAQMWSQTQPIPPEQTHEFFVRAGELLATIARAIADQF